MASSCESFARNLLFVAAAFAARTAVWMATSAGGLVGSPISGFAQQSACTTRGGGAAAACTRAAACSICARELQRL